MIAGHEFNVANYYRSLVCQTLIHTRHHKPSRVGLDKRWTPHIVSDDIAPLNEVLLLLGALPGVTILERHLGTGRAVLKISTLGIVPAYVVQDLCQGANVELHPPLQLRDEQLRGQAERHFTISASIVCFDQMQFGNLQLLGIHLVWHLHRTGVIPTRWANQFLERWGAAQLID